MLSEIKNKKEFEGQYYYLVSEFIEKATGRKRSITSIIDKIPVSEILNHQRRGRMSGVYATEKGIIKLISQLPRFPKVIKEQFGILSYSCSEAEFERLLHGFLTTNNISFKSQYRIGEYKVDFFIPSHNIVIEFNEHYHRSNNNTIRISEIAEDHTVIEVDCRDNPGEALAIINKALEGKSNESISA